jgi:hypothetical protein
MMVVGAVAGFAGGVAGRARRSTSGSMKAEGRTVMMMSVLILGLGLITTGCATTMSDVLKGEARRVPANLSLPD